MLALESIAKQRSDAELIRRIAGFPEAIRPIEHEHAAKGLFKSGATLKRVLQLCKDAVDAQRDTLIAQYVWAINEAIFVSPSWISKLTVEATRSLQPLRDASIEYLEAECTKVGTPQLATRLRAEFIPVVNAAENDIALAIQGASATRTRSVARSIVGFVPNLISRILGAGQK